jgi:hypothetical protein
MEPQVPDNPFMVQISLQELVAMQSKEIASQVSEDLRVKYLEPLTSRVSHLELKQARSTPESRTIDRWKGAMDAAWKIGIILYVAFNVLHKIG